MSETITAALDPISVLRNGWEEFIEREQRKNPPAKHLYVYASAYRECERRMVYEMCEPNMQLPFDTDTLAKFRRGNDRERDLIADLSRVGRDAKPSFRVVGQQERFEVKNREGQIIIVGKKDGDLEFETGEVLPFEVKAWHPNLVQRIEGFDDLMRSPWTKPASYQLLSYLFGFNKPRGILILDRSGLPLPILVELEPHLEQMERFLQAAERAVGHAHAMTLPNFIDDPDECKRCPFYGATCQPPLKHEGAKLISDPELISDLERRETLKESAKEFDALDESVKKRLKGVEMALAGSFSITGKFQSQTKYEIPKDIKEQYKSVDPKGRFLLTITKL